MLYVCIFVYYLCVVSVMYDREELQSMKLARTSDQKVQQHELVGRGEEGERRLEEHKVRGQILCVQLSMQIITICVFSTIIIVTFSVYSSCLT